MKRARVERDLEAAVRGYQVSQLSDVLAAWQQRCGVGRTGDEARQDTKGRRPEVVVQSLLPRRSLKG